VPDRLSGTWREQARQAGHKEDAVAKHRRRLSPEAEKLIALFISAIGPVAKLISAISQIHW
jgi:hypothetical protein